MSAKRDIYDDMPDGDVQREHNRRRLAELQASAAERQERMAQVLLFAVEPEVTA